MGIGLKALKENPNAHDAGVYNNFSPRAQRKKEAKYSEVPSSSESSDDEDGGSPKKSKSKFFKASEKARDDERRSRKDERRKRKLDEDYVPEAAAEGGGESWRHKRRRRDDDEDEYDDGPKSPEQGPDVPFMPKVVSRKIERKLGIKLAKIDPESLMESNTYQRCVKTINDSDNDDDCNNDIIMTMV